MSVSYLREMSFSATKISKTKIKAGNFRRIFMSMWSKIKLDKEDLNCHAKMYISLNVQ